MSENALDAFSAFGLLTAVRDEAGVRLATPGVSSPNIRLASAVHMLRELLALTRIRHEAPVGRRILNVLQFDDYAHHRLPSVGFGRTVGLFPLVELIVDPYFYATRGFHALRQMAETRQLPAWSQRKDILFWRGLGTHNGVAAGGGAVTHLSEVPRISVALHLRGKPNADIGLYGAWLQPQSDEETVAYFQTEGIFRPHTPMVEHAQYKFQLDIDGVANAWATLERFFCGSCVLKVGTPFEMWFYDRIQAWQHFVPVQADLSDIDEKLDWCLSHDEQAREIAEAGRAVALSLTCDHAIELALARIAATQIALG